MRGWHNSQKYSIISNQICLVRVACAQIALSSLVVIGIVRIFSLSQKNTTLHVGVFISQTGENNIENAFVE